MCSYNFVDFTTCSSDQFRCHNGYCLPSRFECDKSTDCLGGEDEHKDCKCSVPNFQPWSLMHLQTTKFYVIDALILMCQLNMVHPISIFMSFFLHLKPSVKWIFLCS